MSESIESKFPSFIDVRYNWQEFKKTGYDNSHLYIKDVKNKGLGVFSKKDINPGDVVEYCHGIVMNTPRQYMHEKSISKYCYWKNDTGIMPLGYGPVYNSAEREFLSNTDYFIFIEDSLVVFVAQKFIPKDTEILVWWGEDYYKSWCMPNH